jgi:hypothetical protein
MTTHLTHAARLLDSLGQAVLADAVRQAAKALAGAPCVDCGGHVLGSRSLRCAACRHIHRTQYHAARYAAKRRTA